MFPEKSEFVCVYMNYLFLIFNKKFYYSVPDFSKEKDILGEGKEV